MNEFRSLRDLRDLALSLATTFSACEDSIESYPDADLVPLLDEARQETQMLLDTLDELIEQVTS